jgi:hypothetical protein
MDISGSLETRRQVELKEEISVTGYFLFASFFYFIYFNGGSMKAVVRMVKREYHGPLYEVRIEDKVEETFSTKSSADFYAEALNTRGVS